jgi:serine/threonine protein kinase
MLIGRSLGAYTLKELLGRGGMGEVYRARDTRLDRDVAIKVLTGDHAVDPERRRRFLQEARAVSALNHPNIVTLYDIASDSGVDFLVLEYVQGQPLHHAIGAGLRPADVLAYAIEIAEALVAAHAAGILHRDIKPANVMITPDRHVKVLDFGLAKLTASLPAGPDSHTRAGGSLLTEAGLVMGTLAYMSPEQARGESLDARTNLFSLGAVLYEMATGRRAFQKPFDWTMPSDARVPAWLRPIVLKLLEQNADLRYQTAADLVVDLKRIQRLTSSTGTPARRWLIPVTLLTGAALTAAVIWSRQDRTVPGRDQWVQLTNFADSVSQPSLSPDGRMLTFVRGPGTFQTEGQVYVKLLPDGEPTQLTRDTFRKMSPVFSPDGTQIAYTTINTQFEWDTWLVSVLGGEPRRWLPNASGLVWLDRQRLLFSEIKTGIHMAIVTAEPTRAGARDVFVPAHERGMGHRSFPSSDLWMTDVDSGRSEMLFPNIPSAGTSGSSAGGGSYDISPDGRRVVLTAEDGEAKSRLWLVAVDRSTQPQRVPGVEGHQPVFGPPGEIVFRANDGNRTWIYRVREDGRDVRKAIDQPAEPAGVSLDGRSLVAWPYGGGATVYSLDGTAPVRVWGRDARLRWSSDGRVLFLSVSTTAGTLYSTGRTYVIPLAPGRLLPDIPSSGFTTEAELAALPGVQIIAAADVAPGPTSSTYAFSREATQRNLYRIPIP